MSNIRSPKPVGNYTKSGSINGTPKARPQKTTMAPKQPNAQAVQPGGLGS
jgi:hypothetical protein